MPRRILVRALRLALTPAGTGRRGQRTDGPAHRDSRNAHLAAARGSGRRMAV